MKFWWWYINKEYTNYFVSRETLIQHCKCRCTPFAKNHIGDGHAPDHGI